MADVIGLSGTIAGVSTLSGAVTVLEFIALSGTIAAEAILSGDIILSSNWQTSTFSTTKRIVVAGSDSIWYEDI